MTATLITLYPSRHAKPPASNPYYDTSHWLYGQARILLDKGHVRKADMLIDAAALIMNVVGMIERGE